MVTTPESIGDALGRPLSTSEATQVALWISDARLLVSLRLGELDELDQPTLDYVVREAVLARLRNPDGAVSETIDDYTYRMPEESRRLTILPEWWDLLSPNVDPGVFSARPQFEPDTIDPLLDWT